MYHLSQETANDGWEVEALYDLCFAPGREALSSYRLRDGVKPIGPLCLLAKDEDEILSAAIRYWRVHVGEKQALLLGPVAVHPTRQGEGLGGLLIMESLNKARELKWERVLLIGDAPYYSRFGFQRHADLKLPPPTNPDRVLSLGLVEGAWDGVTGAVRKMGGSRH